MSTAPPPARKHLPARVRLTEADMLALCRERFAEPAYAFLPHVAEATGGYSTRTADAIAMSVWPSRGLELHGIEVKVSRSDWLSEMRNPAKAEGIAKYMDRWWLAVSDHSIVLPGELPPTWGLLVVRANRLYAATEAPKLQPVALNRSFLASVLRSAARKLVEPDHVSNLLTAEYERGRSEGMRTAQRVGLPEADREAYDRLQAAVRAFNAASGLDIGTRWHYASDAGKMGAAVKFLMESEGWPKVLAAMESVRRADDALHEALSDARLSEVPDFRLWRPRG